MNKKYFFLLFLLSCQSLFSQLDHEFIGGIKLNDSTVITYLINFSEKDGNVTGYSITDLLGPDETKNIIGKSVVIHDGVDDFTSQPSGAAGTRVGCGTIK